MHMPSIACSTATSNGVGLILGKGGSTWPDGKAMPNITKQALTLEKKAKRIDITFPIVWHFFRCKKVGGTVIDSGVNIEQWQRGSVSPQCFRFSVLQSE